MIKKVRMGKEIQVLVVNKIGVLADMSDLLAKGGINIEAVVGYAAGNKAKIMLVTADNSKAIRLLKKAGYNSIQDNEVVILDLENKPGTLKEITARLAQEEIDINELYGTTCTAGCPATIVLSTSNNKEALLALKK